MAIWRLNAGKTTLSVTKAALEAVTDGHAYWIGSDGSLLDAGTDIAAGNVTNQPSDIWDLSGCSESRWSVHHGVMTGHNAGKVGLAELWPITPVNAVGTIPPYVYDVASYFFVAAGMGNGTAVKVLSQKLPAKWQVLYDRTSADDGALDTGPLYMEHLDFVSFAAICSGGTTLMSTYDVSDDGLQVVKRVAAGSATAQQFAVMGLGAGGISAGGVATNMYAIEGLPRRMKVTTTAAGAGNTVRLRVRGSHITDGARIGLVAPYVQFATKPSTASALTLVLSGQVPPGSGIY